MSDAADVHFLLDGMASRYIILADGRRVLLGFLLPGDFCDLHPQLAPVFAHPIISISACSVAHYPRRALAAWRGEFPALATALERWCLVDGAITRRWLTNMAIPAEYRLAHLLCELRTRLAQVGQADEASFPLFLTQQEMGEAIAISTVHINRSLQHLKELGLVRVMNHRVFIPDLARLESFVGFDSAYLEPGGGAFSRNSSAAADSPIQG
ncbi:MAG: Crp/Fnr family transcriptional regulator [Alphaproteobacteria bacterium]|nr:Crp/Fnr family transcriptional regulator [Alphaproteobacteria bacterium]